RPHLAGALYAICVQSQLWVAGGVTALAAFASQRLELETSPLALFMVFSSTLLIYNLDTALDLKTALAEAVEHREAEQLGARQRLAKWLALGALLCLTGLLAISSW